MQIDEDVEALPARKWRNKTTSCTSSSLIERLMSWSLEFALVFSSYPDGLTQGMTEKTNSSRYSSP